MLFFQTLFTYVAFTATSVICAHNVATNGPRKTTTSIIHHQPMCGIGYYDSDQGTWFHLDDEALEYEAPGFVLEFPNCEDATISDGYDHRQVSKNNRYWRMELGDIQSMYEQCMAKLKEQQESYDNGEGKKKLELISLHVTFNFGYDSAYVGCITEGLTRLILKDRQAIQEFESYLKKTQIRDAQNIRCENNNDNEDLDPLAFLLSRMPLPLRLLFLTNMLNRQMNSDNGDDNEPHLTPIIVISIDGHVFEDDDSDSLPTVEDVTDKYDDSNDQENTENPTNTKNYAHFSQQ